ncbi:MAG: carbohydrate-binding domain-containing protein [Spirochaetales bacterium]|nr:carbohydrate-binding domain-containing protein [Spirochaetales bacterium]
MNIKILVRPAAALLLLSALSCTAGAQSGSSINSAGSGTAGQNTQLAAMPTPVSQSVLVASTGQNYQDSLLDTSSMFTYRDLKQTVSLNNAETLSLRSGSSTVIESEGIYLLQGSYRDTMIVVDAGDDAKVQLVLDGLTVTNAGKPAIFVNTADKVFITTFGSGGSLTVSGEFESYPEVNLDATVFSRSDLVLSGTSSLDVVSASGNGITSKDDLKITGGVVNIEAAEDGLEANDSIRIADGDITVVSGKDALHSENSDMTGYFYMQGGSLELSAADDAIQATTVLQIDGGRVNVKTSSEGLEATQVQINGGDITVYATDDGINAAQKSNMSPVISVTGGNIAVTMAAGDTDAFDANGEIYIYGGSIDVNARSSFDADRGARLLGGTVVVNGVEVTELPQGMGGGRGGHGKHW